MPARATGASACARVGACVCGACRVPTAMWRWRRPHQTNGMGRTCVPSHCRSREVVTHTSEQGRLLRRRWGSRCRGHRPWRRCRCGRRRRRRRRCRCECRWWYRRCRCRCRWACECGGKRRIGRERTTSVDHGGLPWWRGDGSGGGQSCDAALCDHGLNRRELLDREQRCGCGHGMMMGGGRRFR